MRVDFRLQYLWKGECFSSKNFMHVLDITLSLVSICARFLWTILTMPGGWIQASPSTCTGTPSSPRMVIFTWRHWDATEQKTAAVRPNFLFFLPPMHRMLLLDSYPPLDLLCPLLRTPSGFMWSRKTCTFKTHVSKVLSTLIYLSNRYLLLWLYCHIKVEKHHLNTLWVSVSQSLQVYKIVRSVVIEHPKNLSALI